MNLDADLVWHNEFRSNDYDIAILPGGFSFGDHLRAGKIAAHSPATAQIIEMANQGGPVLGICNGFQTLTEAGLLPGALLRNTCLRFVCKWMTLRVENDDTAFTCTIPKGSQLRIPIAHNEGRFYADDEALDLLERDRRVAMKYVYDNPTGTVRGITGVVNEEGNVLGMMPHPERASDAALGGTDGLRIFESMVEWARC
jgi:phosphoribosylformylglycinamidine synthase